MGIYVWGTGCGASELIDAGLAVERIAGFVDSYPMGDTFLGRPVFLPEDLPMADCELLIVTTRHTDAVARRCSELGIPEASACRVTFNEITPDVVRSAIKSPRAIDMNLVNAQQRLSKYTVKK